jgi:hypothetical protein
MRNSITVDALRSEADPWHTAATFSTLSREGGPVREEINKMEQRKDAVLGVIRNGFRITEVARLLTSLRCDRWNAKFIRIAEASIDVAARAYSRGLTRPDQATLLRR